jgi:hypothetical protein
MSGGRFDYQQYNINDIADSIERELNRQGKPKDGEDLGWNKEYYETYPEELFYPTYPEEISKKFEEAVKILKTASIYTQRIDWYLSGDDGEESFLRRLEEELKELEDEQNKS